MENIDDNIIPNPDSGNEHQHQERTEVKPVSGMFKDYFIDYASYVILERAVPAIEDGMKPVQRRILHALYEMDDGRFNKVANVIGSTMRYHPHGDASIGDALVQVGQKELLLDMQGNWGNILTGDNAAAPRYIETRLSKIALDVLFNEKTTNWQLSYDGRSREPIVFPSKFPTLLVHGVEGIAVGLSCKMLPHNFIEIIDALIDALKGKRTLIYPDFQQGGMIDIAQYNDGNRGGKVRVRAKITQLDKKVLIISEIPFSTTTGSLIDSIVQANDKGKIKIKKIEDNTAENVEILVHLAPGVSPDVTIDALYAFTQCEVSISPNAVVIQNDKPRFLGVTEIIEFASNQTRDLLRKELEIKLNELKESWHFASLEKIFIENKIYIEFDGKEYEEAIVLTHERLKPHIKHLWREVTDDDLKKLMELPMRRITKHDADKADIYILSLEAEIEKVKNNIEHITDFTIEYFKELKKKYGKGRERKTEIKTFDNINAAQVAANNVKLYVNREEGFVGYGLKKDEFVCDCSDLDDIIVFTQEGKMMVAKATEKLFVGKNIIHVGVFQKNDDRTIYNVIYRDGKIGNTFVKRFAVTSITREKLYDITQEKKGSEILYFTCNPNGEAEIVTVHLKPALKLRKLTFDFDFSQLAIKGRNANGNLLSKFAVKKITLKSAGVSTLGAIKVWFDDTVKRLNNDERGLFLGDFLGDDKIISFYKSGEYKISNFDLTNHFDEDLLLIEKYMPFKIYTAIYIDAEKKEYFIKRFTVEPSDKKQAYLPDDAKWVLLNNAQYPVIQLYFAKKDNKVLEPETIEVHEFETIKGIKAKGKKLSSKPIKEVVALEPSKPDDYQENITEFEDQVATIEDEPITPPVELPSEQLKKDGNSFYADGGEQITFEFDV
jgi:topoisomerase-4 subunit A